MTDKCTMDVVRLKPLQYIHLLNNNTNVTKLLIGPQTYTRLDHEYFTSSAPLSYVSVPPQRYCIILNPVLRDASGAVVFDKYEQAKVRLGDREIRFAQEPFPLYPGEVMAQDVTKLQIVSSTEALHLVAIMECEDETTKTRRRAGDEWIVRGPLTYIPRVEVEVKATLKANVVKTNQALKIRAKANFTGSDGIKRRAGELWLITEPGAYIPAVFEEIVERMDAVVLTPKKAVHVTAITSFTHTFQGKQVQRNVGDSWLVTYNETQVFLPSPQESITATVELTVVKKLQYAVIDNVYVHGKTMLGRRELRRGLCSFFLHPGEVLEDGCVHDVTVLSATDALLLRATQAFRDEDGTVREAGSRWLIRGPCEYTPLVEVEVLELRSAIPLDVNEGVYIRNVRSGEVRAHIGSTIMLTEDEELWNKELDPLVEELLGAPKLTKGVTTGTATASPVRSPAGAAKVARRIKHKVVTCNVPHNSLVQVYDYKQGKARVVHGPDLVMLQPDEEFTVISLSGGRPKQPDMLKTLCIQLGPDFMADEIIIETLDHARLQLVLSYNWEFDQSVKGSAFTVPDFVGDACKAIASRIRGFVSSETFDAFHKNSSNIVKLAVFGTDAHTGLLNKTVEFPVNGLRITNVDVHSVDPVDPKTREALTKSVQLAIEITTKSQEAIAIQQATASEQDAKGKLERQIICDKSLCEKERRRLLEIEAQNAAIESTGSSKAQAKATAEANRIEGQSEVDLAEKRAAASEKGWTAELSIDTAKQQADIEYRAALYALEVERERQMARIEADKFRKIINAIGKETIKAIAKAGPELQAKLLTGLGLQGYLVTDGTNPINLFNTAKGLTAAATGASSSSCAAS